MFQDTLEKLRKLAEQDSETKDNLDAFEDIKDSGDTINETDTDIDNIVPTISPQTLIDDKNAAFIAGLSDLFHNSREKISMFNEMFSAQDLMAPESQYCSALVFTCIQVSGLSNAKITINLITRHFICLENSNLTVLKGTENVNCCSALQ